MVTLDSVTVVVPMFTRLKWGLIWLSPALVSAAKYCALGPPVPAALVVRGTERDHRGGVGRRSGQAGGRERRRRAAPGLRGTLEDLVTGHADVVGGRRPAQRDRAICLGGHADARRSRRRLRIGYRRVGRRGDRGRRR